jgi:uncharacterized membrane protein
MMRLAGWLAIVALALAGHYLDNALLRAACVPALLLLFAAAAPPSLRPALLAAALLLVVPIAWGRGDRVLDLTPALIAALVGLLFARTLRAGRRPLIARAIVALDGPHQLDDPAVARYARRLTWVWAIYQGVLAALALLLALQHWLWPQLAPWLPGPRLFGIVILPLAVAALALGEFLLRPRLLPQAPRHRLHAFAVGLVRAWPAILSE